MVVVVRRTKNGAPFVNDVAFVTKNPDWNCELYNGQSQSNGDDQQGCFVYQVIDNIPIGVRSLPSIDDSMMTGAAFCAGDLMSVDLIHHNASPNSGPFLRLSGHSGWAFEYKKGRQLLEQLTVECGLWVFHVDNVPWGIDLRLHPIDRPDMKVDDDRSLYPMQKVYCDRKVVHPDTDVEYYRVQGTSSWTFDRHPGQRRDGGDHYMLLEESHVHLGLRAYYVASLPMSSLPILSSPNMEPDNQQPRFLHRGDVFLVDCARHDPDPDEPGTFLRLADGSGWVNRHSDYNFEPVFFSRGVWQARVILHPIVPLRQLIGEGHGKRSR